MTNRSRAAHVRRARHRPLLVAVAVASGCLAVTASGVATQSSRPTRAQAVVLLKRAAAELARDDQLVSVVQVLPTPRALRHGAESPNASKLLATERADGADRRDGSRLTATLTGDERRLMGDARPGEIGAFNRARHLLESAKWPRSGPRTRTWPATFPLSSIPPCTSPWRATTSPRRLPWPVRLRDPLRW